MLAPALAYILLLVGVPFLLALVLSVTNSSAGSLDVSFVGLQNFRAVVKSPVFLRALRNTFVTRAVWRSALVGAGAGLIVAATSMLRCPLSGAWHNTFSHAGAVVASAILGALVLSRITRA